MAFAFRARLALLPRAVEPYRFLKQARQRRSLRFLKDGARSSLPQYRQTSFCGGLARDGAGRDPAAFGLFATGAALDFFFAGLTADTSTEGGLEREAIVLRLLSTAPTARCSVFVFK